jgi:hypothetical protein
LAVLEDGILRPPLAAVGKSGHRFPDACGYLCPDRAQAWGISTQRLDFADAPPAVAAAVLGKLI